MDRYRLQVLGSIIQEHSDKMQLTCPMISTQLAERECQPVVEAPGALNAWGMRSPIGTQGMMCL